MITISRIVVLVGSDNLDRDEEAFRAMATKINDGLQQKFHGRVIVETEPYRRGSVEVIITAPDIATAESLVARLVERFAEVQEEAVQQPGTNKLVSRVKSANYVLKFLQENPEHSFTAKDIARKCSITPTYVRNILKKLRDEEKVILVDSPYERSRGRPKLQYRAAP